MSIGKGIAIAGIWVGYAAAVIGVAYFAPEDVFFVALIGAFVAGYTSINL